tara:strand:+ start:369 stop:1127 length:759 start_codon:yes stop_codon:yes gene_type:complete
MYEILVNPITLLCLGIIFIFTSLLFFYFKRTFSLLEKAQMDQARVLQGFITNMEMSQQLAAQRMNQMGGAPPPQHSPVNDSSEQVNDGLIDVSDDDDSDSEYESDSDDETENNDDVSVGSKLDIEPQVIELNQASDVKIIQLEGNNNLENSTIEIASLEELEELEDMNDIDDDDTSDDDSDDDEESEEANVTEKVLLESSGIEKEVKKLEKIDYKSLNVQALRDYCISCGVIQGGDKKNKKEMIKLLDDMEK